MQIFVYMFTFVYAPFFSLSLSLNHSRACHPSKSKEVSYTHTHTLYTYLTATSIIIIFTKIIHIFVSNFFLCAKFMCVCVHHAYLHTHAYTKVSSFLSLVHMHAYTHSLPLFFSLSFFLFIIPVIIIRNIRFNRAPANAHTSVRSHAMLSNAITLVLLNFTSIFHSLNILDSIF